MEFPQGDVDRFTGLSSVVFDQDTVETILRYALSEEDEDGDAEGELDRIASALSDFRNILQARINKQPGGEAMVDPCILGIATHVSSIKEMMQENEIPDERILDATTDLLRAADEFMHASSLPFGSRQDTAHTRRLLAAAFLDTEMGTDSVTKLDAFGQTVYEHLLSYEGRISHALDIANDHAEPETIDEKRFFNALNAMCSEHELSAKARLKRSSDRHEANREYEHNRALQLLSIVADKYSDTDKDESIGYFTRLYDDIEAMLHSSIEKMHGLQKCQHCWSQRMLLSDTYLEIDDIFSPQDEDSDMDQEVDPQMSAAIKKQALLNLYIERREEYLALSHYHNTYSDPVYESDSGVLARFGMRVLTILRIKKYE